MIFFSILGCGLAGTETYLGSILVLVRLGENLVRFGEMFSRFLIKSTLSKIGADIFLTFLVLRSKLLGVRNVLIFFEYHNRLDLIVGEIFVYEASSNTISGKVCLERHVVLAVLFPLL